MAQAEARRAKGGAGDGRRWARRVTLALVVGPSLLALPRALNALAHARTDSEAGVMMYGFPLFVGLVYGGPVVGAFTLAWGVGLVRARRRGEAIPRWEMGAFGVVATLIALSLPALSDVYLRMVFRL